MFWCFLSRTNAGSFEFAADSAVGPMILWLGSGCMKVWPTSGAQLQAHSYLDYSGWVRIKVWGYIG